LLLVREIHMVKIVVADYTGNGPLAARAKPK